MKKIDEETYDVFGKISFINGARQAFRSILDLRAFRREIDVDSLFEAIESVKNELDEMLPDEIKELDDMAPCFEIKVRKETMQ